MNDLISRQMAINGLDAHYVERINLNDWQCGWNAALDWMNTVYLDELPSAQSKHMTLVEKILDFMEDNYPTEVRTDWERGCAYALDEIKKICKEENAKQ